MSRAVEFHGSKRPLKLVSIEPPTLQEGEALVRVLACNLCRSDLHSHAGRRNVATPTILGHEIVGRLEAFAPTFDTVDMAGQSASIGDRITWSIIAACGKCFFCRHALPQKCKHQFKYGHEAINARRNLGGGLADFVILLPGTAWLRVPEEMPDSIAALANCSAATAAAVLRHAGSIVDQTVLVFGVGVLGALACAMASAGGAREVIAVDPDPACRDRAMMFGATHAVSAASVELTSLVADTSNGVGPDIVLELSGITASAESALSLVRTGGTVILAGAVATSAPLTVDPESIVRRMISIRGVHNYHPRDLRSAVKFLSERANDFPFGLLMGETYPLEQAEAAFRCAQQAIGVRVTVTPQTCADS